MLTDVGNVRPIDLSFHKRLYSGDYYRGMRRSGVGVILEFRPSLRLVQHKVHCLERKKQRFLICHPPICLSMNYDAYINLMGIWLSQ